MRRIAIHVPQDELVISIRRRRLLGVRIRQPEQHFLIRRRKEVEPRVERHYRRLSRILYRVGWGQRLVLLQLGERIPHDNALLRAADDEPAIWRETAVSAALDVRAVPSTVHGGLVPGHQPAGGSTFGFAEIGFQLPAERIEKKVPSPFGTQEYRFSVVGKLQLRPASHDLIRVNRRTRLDNIKHANRGLVEISMVVDQNLAARRRTNGKDLSARVPGREIGRIEMQYAGSPPAPRIPQSYRVVLTTRDEIVGARMHRQVCDSALVAFEIPYERVIVCRQVAYRICRGPCVSVSLTGLVLSLRVMALVVIPFCLVLA